MVKEFEKAGFPVVHMCNLSPVSTTVGANRIVPTISIPYPLGDPNSPREEQWKLRYHRLGVALQALGSHRSASRPCSRPEYNVSHPRIPAGWGDIAALPGQGILA